MDDPSQSFHLDAPAAFFHALRHLRLPYTLGWVRSRFRQAEGASGLIVLVNLAPAFGLAPQACRCTLEDLERTGAPAILCFEILGSATFGTFLGVEGRHVVLAARDGSTRRLALEEVQRLWTGVAVLFDRDDALRVAERGYALARAKEQLLGLLAGLPRRLPLAAGSGGFLRALAVLLLPVLLAINLGEDFRRQDPWRWAGLGFLLCAAIGAGASAVLYMMSGRPAALRPGAAQRWCGRGRWSDCDSVLHSRWGGIGRWRLADLGLGWFLSILALMACGVLRPSGGELSLWLGVSFLSTAPISLFLVGVQLWPLRKLCPPCLVVHGAVLAGALVGWAVCAAAWTGPGSEVAGLWRVAAIHLLLLLAALGVLLPWAEARHEVALLRSTVAQATSTPLGSLALAAAEPIVRMSAGEDILAWGDPAAPLRVDLQISPLCQSCGPVLRHLLRLQQARRGKIYLALHLVPKTGGGRVAEGALCTAITALGALRGGDHALLALERVRSDPSRWLAAGNAGPEEVLGSLVALAPGEGQEALLRGRQVVAEASAIAKRLSLGLPAVFVGGRFFNAPVEHLDLLLADHDAILLSSLGNSQGGA
jgi:uncharacterized membrane protein